MQLIRDGVMLRSCATCRHLGAFDWGENDGLGHIARRCEVSRMMRIFDATRWGCPRWEETGEQKCDGRGSIGPNSNPKSGLN